MLIVNVHRPEHTYISEECFHDQNWYLLSAVWFRFACLILWLSKHLRMLTSCVDRIYPTEPSIYIILNTSEFFCQSVWTIKSVGYQQKS